MSVIMIPMASPYFKKDDAEEYFNNRKNGTMFVGILYSLISIVIPYFIGKVVTEEFSSLFNSNESFLFSLAPIIAIVGVSCYWLFTSEMFSKQYKDDFFSKVSKYKDGEMINMNKVIDSRKFSIGVIIYIISLMLSIFFLTYPVFLVEGRLM